MDRVMVQVFKPETKTAAGIYLPEASKQVINQGKVIAVGAGRMSKDDKLIPCSVNVGDNVVIPEYGGMNIKFDNEEYKVFRDEDIVGLLEKE